MKVSLKRVKLNIGSYFSELTKRAKGISLYLTRVVLPEYINVQRNRFATQNSGADFGGAPWGALDPTYLAYKQKKYQSYPGGGNKINIRTSRLLNSLLLQENNYSEPTWERQNNSMLGLYANKSFGWSSRVKGNKKKGQSKGGTGKEYASVVNDAGLYIYTLVPYAKYVDEKRTFSDFSPFFFNRIHTGIMNYIASVP